MAAAASATAMGRSFGHTLQELRDASVNGDVELGVELRERLEHEAPLVQPRVRHAQSRLVDHL